MSGVVGAGIFLATALAYPFEVVYRRQIMNIDQVLQRDVTIRQTLSNAFK
jgi:hypothetical protein